MKLLLDQNLPHRAAVLMREAGHDCLHVAEIDLALAEDHEIIRWVAQEKRICITRDADFHALLATSGAPRHRSFGYELRSEPAGYRRHYRDRMRPVSR